MLPDNEIRFDASGQAWLDQLVQRHESNASQLLQILREVQEHFGHIPHQVVTRLAKKLSIPRARIESVASFYSFLHLKPHGEYRVLFSDNITDRMLGSQALMELMCQQLWLQPGKVSEDGLVSIGTTSCTGMCDQGPALLVNGRAITNLTHQRVQEIVQLIRNRTPLADWPADFFRVEDNIRRSGLLLDSAPLRPLFPEGFYNEVQVVAMVVSLNPEVDPDIPAIIGASAAMAISGIPFDGPLGAARVGYIDGHYVLNPTLTQLKGSQLNLVVAGTQSAVLMVESEADILSEEVMLGAVVYGHDQMQVVINAINELVEEAGKPEWVWAPAAKNEELVAKLNELVESDLQEAFRITSKQQRTQRIREISDKAVEVLTAGADAPDANTVKNLFFDVEAKIVRSRILGGEPRIDGRDTRTVRPIAIRSSVLPRTHGSALFTRGETQALVERYVVP